MKKNKYYCRYGTFLLFNLYFSVFHFLNCAGQYLKVEGVFKDVENNENVPFVNISIAGASLGTTSNSEGRFIFSLPEKHLKDSLSISFVGYESLKTPVRDLINKNNTIFLKKSTYILNEIYVTTSSAKDIVRKCIQQIPVNYSNSPVIARGYFLSASKENNIFSALMASFERIYFKNYSNKRHEVIHHSVLIEHEDLRIDKVTEGKGPLKEAFSFDHINYRKGFLNVGNLDDWKFEIEGRVPFDKDTVVVIRVDYIADPRLINHHSRIFIDHDNYAILKIEFDYNWFFKESVQSFRNWSGIFQYRKFGKKYFPNHFSFSITRGSQRKESEIIDTVQHISNEWIMNDLQVLELQKKHPHHNDSVVVVWLKGIHEPEPEYSPEETAFYKRVVRDIEYLKRLRYREDEEK